MGTARGMSCRRPCHTFAGGGGGIESRESRNSAIADQYPCCTHVSSAPRRQPLPPQTTRCRPLTVRARFELHKPREFRYASSGLVLLSVVAWLGVHVTLAARDALPNELPQLLYVFSWHDLILDAAEEEHRRLSGGGRNLGGQSHFEWRKASNDVPEPTCKGGSYQTRNMWMIHAGSAGTLCISGTGLLLEIEGM